MRSWKIPNNLQKDFELLKQRLSKLTSRAYFTGGFVRDTFLGRSTNDIDIEIYDVPVDVFEQFAKDIGAKGVGRSFYVYKWGNFDLSLPRTESKVAYGHKGFDVELCKDTKYASRRRDFTVNSILVGIFKYELIDHFDGIKDLNEKKLKVVNDLKFKEDSLRVLRAVQFSSRFAFRIDSSSITLMRDISINDLSSERIFVELEKFFLSQYLHFGLYYLSLLGLDKKIFDVKITKNEFLYISLNYNKIDQKFKKFRFIYLLSSIKRVSPMRYLDKINAPKEYYKMMRYQKKVPSNITKKWICAVGLKVGIDQFIGNYAFDKNEFKNLKVDPQEVINEGFVKDGIKKEIRKRELDKLRGIR
jgi:tRNA nucleotidyltransferase (CCA-adding enzyme)